MHAHALWHASRRWIALALISFGLQVPPSAAFSQTLHAVLVATSALPESGAGDISAGALEGLRRMDRLLDGLAEQAGLSYNSYQLSGASFHARRLNETLDSIHPSAEDIVVFWYGGHGLHDPKATDRFPAMFIPSDQSDVRPKPTSPTGYGAWQLVEVRRRLALKRPALLLVIYDSCSSLVSGYLPNPSYGTARSLPRTARVAQAAKALLSARGTISIAGAEVGTEGWVGKDGGYFTNQLVNTIVDRLAQGEKDWSALLTSATRLIDDKYGHVQQPVKEAVFQ